MSNTVNTTNERLNAVETVTIASRKAAPSSSNEEAGQRIGINAAQKRASFERTSQIAGDAIVEERRRREEKTERLRQARLQAEQQQRQL